MITKDTKVPRLHEKQVKTPVSEQVFPPVSTPFEARLGNTASYVVAPSETTTNAEKFTDKLFTLKLMASEILGGRVKTCGCNPISRNALIGLKKTEAGKHHFSGLQHCGSVWSCPVCAVKITKERENELGKILEYYISNNFKAGMLTLTSAHYHNESADQVKSRLLGAWREIQQARPYRKLKKEFPNIEIIRNLEVKLGANGWHPHCHFAIIGADENTIEIFSNSIISLWCENLGTQENGQQYATEEAQDFRLFRTDDVATMLSIYISKSGLSSEMTLSHNKNNGQSLSPFGILEKIVESEKSGMFSLAKYYRSKYSEYAKAFKGHRQLVYSSGIQEVRKKLKIAEKTDEQIANETQVGEVEINIDRVIFSFICYYKLQREVIKAWTSSSEADRIPNVLYIIEKRCNIETFFSHEHNAIFPTAKTLEKYGKLRARADWKHRKTLKKQKNRIEDLQERKQYDPQKGISQNHNFLNN